MLYIILLRVHKWCPGMWRAPCGGMKSFVFISHWLPGELSLMCVCVKRCSLLCLGKCVKCALHVMFLHLKPLTWPLFTVEKSITARGCVLKLHLGNEFCAWVPKWTVMTVMIIIIMMMIIIIMMMMRVMEYDSLIGLIKLFYIFSFAVDGSWLLLITHHAKREFVHELAT